MKHGFVKAGTKVGLYFHTAKSTGIGTYFREPLEYDFKFVVDENDTNLKSHFHAIEFQYLLKSKILRLSNHILNVGEQWLRITIYKTDIMWIEI